MRRRNRLTYDELVEEFLQRQRNANTASAYRADLSGFAQWCAEAGCEPLAADAGRLDDYRLHLEGRGASPATVSRRLAALSSFFMFAVGRGVRAASPVAHTVRPAPRLSGPQALTAPQCTDLLAAGDAMGAKTALLLSMLLVDGLRLGEVLQADVVDLVDGERSLTVRRRRGPVELDLRQATTAAAHAYLQGRTSGPLLLGGGADRDGERLTRFGADYLVKRAAAQAGLPHNVSAGTLRRTYVAQAHDRGESVEHIRDHLGHQDARTTRRHLGQ